MQEKVSTYTSDVTNSKIIKIKNCIQDSQKSVLKC